MPTRVWTSKWWGSCWYLCESRCTLYENYTVAETEVFCHKLNEILRVSSEGVLRLCRVDKGCFQLMFQVPSFVQHAIFPLCKEQERALSALHVITLTCGEYLFKVKWYLIGFTVGYGMKQLLYRVSIGALVTYILCFLAEKRSTNKRWYVHSSLHHMWR